MSTSPVAIRLSGDPGALSPEAFVERSEVALAPVIRALGEPRVPTTDLGPASLPRLIPGGGFEPPLGFARSHGLPLSTPAALYCAPLQAGAPCAWHTHLVWPRPEGPAAVLALAHVVLMCTSGRSMVEITLSLSGFPLTDLEPRLDGQNWVLAPSPGRSAETGDWKRLVAALEDLDDALSGLSEPYWGVETTGFTEQEDARRLIALRDRLNSRRASRA